MVDGSRCMFRSPFTNAHFAPNLGNILLRISPLTKRPLALNCLQHSSTPIGKSLGPRFEIHFSFQKNILYE